MVKENLTEAIIDSVINGRPIRCLSVFDAPKRALTWQCTIETCNKIWQASLYDIRRGRGCPECAKKKKIERITSNRLTNEILDERLIGRFIKRLGNYINNSVPIDFLCEACYYIWPTSPDSIFSGCGCPRCSKTIKLTNEIVDNRNQGKSIKRLGNVNGADTPIPYRCEIEGCNHEWNISPSNLAAGRGCPKCAKHIKHTNEALDPQLNARNIERLANYVGIDEIIPFRCLICNYEWSTSTNSIINGGTGCPSCSHRATLTNDIIDERICGRPIKRIGNYINLSTPIDWQCTISTCNNIWPAKPADIIHQGTGCPICNIPGHNEKLLVDTLKELGPLFEHDYNIKKINSNATNKYKLDIFYQQFNFAIELNGKQHYSPSKFGSHMSDEEALENLAKQQSRDAYVDQFCKDNGITIIWIDGREYFGAKLKQYIIEAIIPLINKQSAA